MDAKKLKNEQNEYNMKSVIFKSYYIYEVTPDLQSSFFCFLKQLNWNRTKLISHRKQKKLEKKQGINKKSH